jgi:molybdopterin-guanine dinucleotide biosynthesis protein A
MRTAGFVLVGGNSSRMEQDKALLPWRGETLVENIARKVQEAAGNVALVGRAHIPGIQDFECLPDLRPGCGPLGGIETALGSGRGELNLILACDLPLLDGAVPRQLLDTAAKTNAKCVVATSPDGRVHPLCAVYGIDCLPTVRLALDARRLKLMDLLGTLRAEYFKIRTPMWNVNTPEEWHLAQEAANAG